VTITHPQMRRFFMLIPEAVQLVLHGAALGEHGALYVFDMGEQIPLLEIARNLIRISGHIPDQDISIVFTGMRPGEKLYEELVGADEICEPSGVEKVMRVVQRQPLPVAALRQRIVELGRAALKTDTTGVLEQLSSLVGGLHRPEEDAESAHDLTLPLSAAGFAAGRSPFPTAIDATFLRRAQ
jgi:FlaA1/EpsC-like NDP-sugar epimerase